MKIIKFLLTLLATAAYTSLIWATVIWNGLPVGPNNILILLITSVFATLFIVVMAVLYLEKHWSDE